MSVDQVSRESMWQMASDGRVQTEANNVLVMPPRVGVLIQAAYLNGQNPLT